MTTIKRSLLQLHRISTLKNVLICATLYFLVVIFQPYYMAPPPGWIDPWINLGYGQVFPETAYPGHYYKESRLLSIIWVAFVLIFPNEFYSYIMAALIAATGFILYKAARELKAVIVTSIFSVLLVTLNPMLWGDQAGGGDYYNTFGNFLIALGVYRLVIPVFKTNRDVFNRRSYFVECGFWLSVITLEIPSGLIVSAMIFSFLAITFYLNTNLKFDKKQQVFLLLQSIGKLVLGLVILLFLEALLLLLLNQNPDRLFAGPKFLFDSLFDSSTQSQWWSQMPFNDLQSLPPLFLFLLLTSVYLLRASILIFWEKRKNGVNENEFFLVTVFLFFLIALVIMQIFGKTIALNSSYFLTPILMLLVALLPAFITERNSWLFVIVVLFVVSYSFDRRFLTLSIIIFSVVFFGMAQKRLDWIYSWFFVLLLTFSLLASGASFSLDQPTRKFISEVCDKERLKFRSDVIDASRQLDRFGPRGSILMGSDDFAFTKKVSSECHHFDGAPLSYYLISLSALGYPGASSLGPLKSQVEPIGNKYAFESFSQITNRMNSVTGCYINFVEKETGKRLVISQTIINYEHVCVGDVS